MLEALFFEYTFMKEVFGLAKGFLGFDVSWKRDKDAMLLGALAMFVLANIKPTRGIINTLSEKLQQAFPGLQ